MAQSLNYEARLLALRAEYQKRIDDIAQTLAQQSQDQQDWSDQAALHENDDTIYTLRQEAQEQLQHVNAALQRLADGQYGICTSCGMEIEAKRLEAIPYATQCMSHAV